MLFDKFGIEKGILTTVHAYTNSQRLLDLEAEDPTRCSRCCVKYRSFGNWRGKSSRSGNPTAKGQVCGHGISRTDSHRISR